MVSVTRDEFLAHEETTKDVIDVKRIYVDMAGDLVAGVMLSQIVFWHLPSKQNGNSKLRVYHKGEYWIAKKREDWWDECRITPKQVDRAIKELEDANLIVTDVLKFDGSPTKHVRIDWPVFLASYQNIVNSAYMEGVKSKSPKGQNRISPKGNIEIDQTVKSLTETTAETTAENTSVSADAENFPSELPSAEGFDSQERAEKEQELQAKANAEFDAIPSASAGLPSRELTAAAIDPHAELTELAEDIAAALDADLEHLPQAKTAARKMIVAYGDKARATLRAYLNNPKNREYVRDKNPNALVGLLQAEYARSFKHNRHGGVLRTGVAYGG